MTFNGCNNQWCHIECLNEIPKIIINLNSIKKKKNRFEQYEKMRFELYGKMRFECHEKMRF